jgi:hypothetical protein
VLKSQGKVLQAIEDEADNDDIHRLTNYVILFLENFFSQSCSYTTRSTQQRDIKHTQRAVCQMPSESVP